MTRVAPIVLASVLAGCPTAQDPGFCFGVPCAEGGTCNARTGECTEPSDTCTPTRVVGEFAICTKTSDDAYLVIARYDGSRTLDLEASDVRLNGQPIDVRAAFDAPTRTFKIHTTEVEPSKYSFVFRLRDTTGAPLRPLFVPMWVGPGTRYRGFTWRDSILYQIFTDRFLDGNPTNNLDNSVGDLARVTDPRSQWQGGDFAGITQKIRDGYFEAMGVNTLWISSPILNSHNSQPGVGLGDPERYASYHSYHPIATGHTHLDDYGYPNPIEPAFGTPDELHELVNEAHRRGIRIIPDFVTNHVQREANMYARHPEWFFPYLPCDGRWDEGRLDCWFTSDMPDIDYGGNPAAITAVVDHALWMIQEFNFDGFRADALKHMDDAFVRALKRAVIEEIETTVRDHSRAIEPTVFYMVGESLGGWARYHVREDMVQGQVDEEYYNVTKGALLTFDLSVRQLAEFAIYNDTAYLTPRETFGGYGGYAGAIMGNFFGNHDQVRALTEAYDRGGGYERLRLAQTFLMTSPGNIPMLYQGDDIGTEGRADPDNRKMQRFTGLSLEEQRSLANVQKAGLLRAKHRALRHGTRSHVVVEDWFWVYKVSDEDDEVYVAINRDDTKSWSPPPGFVDGLGNCAGGVVPVLSSCIFVRP
jgi:glycosidase